MAGYAAADLTRAARDVETRHPDLILLDRASGDLFRSGASAVTLRQALAAYHPVARTHDVELLVRNGLDDRPRQRD